MSWLDDLTRNEQASDLLGLVLFLAAAFAAYWLVRLMLPAVRRAVRRSRFRWDDVLLDRKLQSRLGLLAPASLAFYAASVSRGTSAWWEVARRSSTALLLLFSALAISAFLRAFNVIYERDEHSRDRPIEAYIQLAQIVVFMFAIVAVAGVLVGRSPLLFLGGLSALTAVLLLVFRDTILSFVASIEIVQGDLVDVGDRIEMPSFNANGYVTDLELHTVTVENFDRSITSIPTHRFLTEPFWNWKGMEQLGRRRMKRALYIDVSTIRFLTAEELDRFAAFEPLVDYMESKRKEIAAEESRSVGSIPNRDRRRLTNIGTLRAYITQYLIGLDTVDTEDALYSVRQLEPGPHGLPIEVYAFIKNADFQGFEDIQADIFDHILAMVPEFGLSLFQGPRTEPPSDTRPADEPTPVAAAKPAGPW